jgi:hypothetical protein
MTETEAPDDDGMPTEVFMHAVDLALSEGKSVILEAYGIVVVPDITALTAIAHGKELPDTQRYHTKDGREVMVYSYPELEAVDQIFEDD